MAKVSYLDFRFVVTDLTEEQRDGLAGEVTAQAESSERHPDVEVESELVEYEVCDDCQRDPADCTCGKGRPTEGELATARERLAPYFAGYPEPMIDTRRLRIANGQASEKDRREVAAEDYVIREWKRKKG